jgi:hypothetical protein
MVLISFILSLLAFLLAASRWIIVILEIRARRHIGRSSPLRVELLIEGVNCFLSRGGYSLFLVSFRVYNDSDQRPLRIDSAGLAVKVRRRWRYAHLYETEQGNIFPSLVRNSLPVDLGSSESLDLFEVFQYDDLMDSTDISVRIECQETGGEKVVYETHLYHRTDNRPVFDILFRTLGV